MKTWILIAIAIVLAVGLLYISTATATAEEGFLTVDPDAISTQRILLQAEGERRYNDLARVQSPRAQIPADQVDAAIRQTVPTPSHSGDSLLSLLGFTAYGAADDGTNKQGTGVEQTGMVQQKINFCEGITNVDCNLLNDPRLAECGFCHKDGTNSRGKAHRGGMYISSDDQIRTNERAGNGKAYYNPTVGTCKPLNFTLMKDNCVARENDLECQRAGAATVDNKCGQCFGSSPPGSTGLLYMGPHKMEPYTATLWVSHPGSHTAQNTSFGTVIKVNGQTYGFNTSNKPDLDPQQQTIQIAEGMPMTIEVYGVPRFWCAWLVDSTGNRSIGLNLGETGMTPDDGMVIAGGSNAGPLLKVMNASPDSGAWPAFKATVPSNTLWYQRREILRPAITRAYYANGNDGTYQEFTPQMKAFAGAGMDGSARPEDANGLRFLFVNKDNGSTNTIAVGSTIKAALFSNKFTLNITIPATLVEPHYADDKADCPSGPIIMTGQGATLMGANSCFAPDGSFAPTLGCIRMLFGSAGGMPKGTLYPQSEADAQALAQKDPATGQLTLDATVAYFNNMTNIALYGVDSNGGPAHFDEIKDKSLKMLGITLNNPCDGPSAATGPHSPECLDYLWRTSGNSSGDGSPVDMTKLPYSYCSAKGVLSPLNSDGSINQANVDLANQYGSIPGIRSVYQYVYEQARNTTAGFDHQAGMMRNCYGTNLKPPAETPGDCPAPAPSDWQCFGPSKMAQPEVFYVSNGGYNTKQADADAVCQTFSARVASTAELAKAQLAGADWCASGWVSDSTDAKYPISTSTQGGCGNGSTGVMTYTPPSGQAGVNCIGKKPTQQSALAVGVSPHSAGNWNNPHGQTDPPQVSFFPALNPSIVLRHAGYQFWTQGGNINDPTYQKDSSFQIMPANNGRAGYVSFQSVNFPDFYLRHYQFRCILQQNKDSNFNDDSSFLIVAALNGDPNGCSIQSSNFPDRYIAPLSAASPNDVWITPVNRSDQKDKTRASWIRSTSILQVQNQPFSATAVPACKVLNGQVVCASNDGQNLILWGSEDGCNQWANPVDANSKPSASVTYNVGAPPPQNIAGVIDKYLRTRV